MAGGPALADRPPGVALHYNVYAGGMRVLSSEIDVRIDGESYAIELAAEPRGLVGLFSAWRFEAAAQGSADGAISPVRYATADRDRREVKTTSLTFGPGGATFVEQPPRDRSREAPVPPELRAGALDPLSAVMALSQAVGAGHGCDMTVPVFDGRRRYDMVVADLGQRQLSASGVAGYHGPAQLCSARMVPVAGAWKDPDSNSLWRRPRRGEVVPEHRIDVWIGRPIPGGPAFMVKAQAHSDLGPVMIHLAAAEPLHAEPASAQLPP